MPERDSAPLADGLGHLGVWRALEEFVLARAEVTELAHKVAEDGEADDLGPDAEPAAWAEHAPLDGGGGSKSRRDGQWHPAVEVGLPPALHEDLALSLAQVGEGSDAGADGLLLAAALAGRWVELEFSLALSVPLA